MGCTRLRQLLEEDQPAWGVFITMTDPAGAEIAGYSGYDFAVVDMEHTSLDLQTVENMLRAAAAAGITSIVRVPENAAKLILRVLELGPDGVLIPHVRDADDARRAVEAARYQPLGDRGISGATRAAQYGRLGADFVAFTEGVNRDLLVIALIEDVSAVEDIEGIAAVEGLDVCFVGPADLARSLGRMGVPNEPLVGEAIHRLAAGVRSVGKAKFGMPILDRNFPLDSREVVALGARMITCGADIPILFAAFEKELQRAKAALSHPQAEPPPN